MAVRAAEASGLAFIEAKRQALNLVFIEIVMNGNAVPLGFLIVAARRRGQRSVPGQIKYPCGCL